MGRCGSTISRQFGEPSSEGGCVPDSRSQVYRQERLHRGSPLTAGSSLEMAIFLGKGVCTDVHLCIGIQMHSIHFLKIEMVMLKGEKKILLFLFSAQTL